MKELILIRHAKSDWGDENLKDIDRPLNERGYSDAYYTSEWFVKTKKTPDAILSSTATRALNTALIFARTMDFNMACFALNKKLYESNVVKVLDIIKEQKNEYNSLMLFFHNPAITNFSNEVSEDTFFENIPTCGMVSFNFNAKNWENIGLKSGKLNYHQFPKDFKNRN